MAQVTQRTTTTPQKLAKVPQGWTRRIDRTLGYSIALPPGWRPQRQKAATLIQPPDRLVAVSISADRTPDALGVPVDQFATRALAALPGYRGGLDPGRPQRFVGTPLDAVSSEASGTLVSSGVLQNVTVVVLRRDDEVNYTAVVAANAGRATAAEDHEALQMLRTVRDYPVGLAPGPSNGD